jgi:hypothetical protein
MYIFNPNNNFFPRRFKKKKNLNSKIFRIYQIQSKNYNFLKKYFNINLFQYIHLFIFLFIYLYILFLGKLAVD